MRLLARAEGPLGGLIQTHLLEGGQEERSPRGRVGGGCRGQLIGTRLRREELCQTEKLSLAGGREESNGGSGCLGKVIAEAVAAAAANNQSYSATRPTELLSSLRFFPSTVNSVTMQPDWARQAEPSHAKGSNCLSNWIRSLSMRL